MVRDLGHMLQNHVRHPWDHAGVACDRLDVSGERANIVRKNEVFAAKRAGVVSDLDSNHLRLVGMARSRATVDLSIDAAAPAPAAEGSNLESDLA